MAFRLWGQPERVMVERAVLQARAHASLQAVISCSCVKGLVFEGGFLDTMRVWG